MYIFDSLSNPPLYPSLLVGFRAPDSRLILYRTRARNIQTHGSQASLVHGRATFSWCCIRLRSTFSISRTHHGAVTPAVTSRLRDFSDEGSDELSIASAGLHRYRAGGIRLLGPRLLQQDVRLNWTFSCMRMHTQREARQLLFLCAQRKHGVAWYSVQVTYAYPARSTSPIIRLRCVMF